MATSPKCAYLEVSGWTLGGDFDVFLSHDVNGVDSNGDDCGGDGYSVFYAVRGGMVVYEVSACECEPAAGDFVKYQAVTDALSGRNVVIANLGNTGTGWYIRTHGSEHDLS